MELERMEGWLDYCWRPADSEEGAIFENIGDAAKTGIAAAGELLLS